MANDNAAAAAVNDTVPESETGTESEAEAGTETGVENVWDDLANDTEDSDVVEGEVVEDGDAEATAPEGEGEGTDEAGEGEEGAEQEPEGEEAAAEPEPTAGEPEPEKVEEVAGEEPVPSTPETKTPEEQAEIRAKAEEQLVEYFALDEDDAELVQTNPQEVLPKLAAKLYLDLYESTVNAVSAALPRMIEGVQQQRQAMQAGEQAFYGKWKALDTKEGRETVQRFGAAYRQVYPNATLEQFINDVGVQAMIALKLPIEGYAEPPATEPPPATQVPPAPAAATNTPARRQSSASQNPFAQLAEEILDEEENF